MNMPTELSALVPAFPLLAALAIVLFHILGPARGEAGEKLTARITLTAITLSFVTLLGLDAIALRVLLGPDAVAPSAALPGAFTLAQNYPNPTSISTPRTGHSVVTVGGTLYVLGGWGGSEPIGSVEAGTITIFPPPANDNFAAAMVINSLPFSDIQNTAGATIEYGEPQNLCLFITHSLVFIYADSERFGSGKHDWQ